MKPFLLMLWTIGSYPVICALAFSDWHAGKLDGYWFWVVCWFAFVIVSYGIAEMKREAAE